MTNLADNEVPTCGIEACQPMTRIRSTALHHECNNVVYIYNNKIYHQRCYFLLELRTTAIQSIYT